MPKQPDPAAVTPIDVPETVYDRVLHGTVLMFNAIILNALLFLFSPVFKAATVRADLLAALASDQARGKARGAYRMTAAERQAVEKETTFVFSHLSPTIEGGMPIGSAFRGDYFPLASTNPSTGDLLISFSEGTAKHGWPTLPHGWTPAYLKDLGQRSNVAQAQSEASAAGRSGQAKASQAVSRNVAKIRTSMRLLLVGWYGSQSAELLKFGLQPRKPGPGRRLKSKAKAPVAAQPAPVEGEITPE